jgi:hypothetical protein
MMKRLIFLALLLVFMSGCALNTPYTIPMNTQVERMEGRKIPLEAALLITPEAREGIFRSPDYPNFHGRFVVYNIEPYQLPVGQAFERACLQVFSQFFEKVTLIRTREEGKNYRLVIEPQMNDFYLDLFYTSTGDRFIYEELVDERCKVKISGTMKSYDRTIWERVMETPLETKRWVNSYQLRNEVASFASDTIVLAVKMLAYQIARESQSSPPPQPVRNWLDEVSPAR